MPVRNTVHLLAELKRSYETFIYPQRALARVFVYSAKICHAIVGVINIKKLVVVLKQRVKLVRGAFKKLFI